jgi:hypothetical protein
MLYRQVWYLWIEHLSDSDLIIPFCRLSITTESVIPSTVKLWNRLDQSDRNLDTLTKFKKAIRKEQSDNTKRISKHFYYGPRKLNIILTQLRNSYSFLNYDLSKVNIVNDDACSCGAPREDAYHYFFTCPNYTKNKTYHDEKFKLGTDNRYASTNMWVWWFNIWRKYQYLQTRFQFY